MDNTPLPLFGTRVAELRASKGISQEDLARRAGISVAHLSHLEQNRHRNVTLGTFCRLVAALDITPQELIESACASLSAA